MTGDQPGRRAPQGRSAVLAGLSALLLGALGIATNQATALLPQEWDWVQAPWLWWSLVAILTSVVTTLAVWQIRSSSRSGDRAAREIDATADSLQHVGSAHGGHSGMVIANLRTGHLTINQSPAGEQGSTSTIAIGGEIEERLWNIPAPVRSFTDREMLIDSMTGLLSAGEGPAQVSTLALYGMGGVGKTQVARA